MTAVAAGNVRAVSAIRSRRRWFEAADSRHATEGLPVHAGDVVATLCGRSVAAVRPLPGRYAPECAACDREWRAVEGIAQRDEHLPVRSLETNGDE